ncbi:hypothetical protein [Sporosarcina sp. NPDC096371]|uniref:hypothetical protein n=1 Tax=Sporosarcina sp. NPDC096371 TaxID=3364530 RepID=UPI0038173C08
MVNLYANRIVADVGKENGFTIDNVPSLWNAKTITELNKRGYDGYGQPLDATA